jgi:tetratricopeptide (TPR) repeat protein
VRERQQEVSGTSLPRWFFRLSAKVPAGFFAFAGKARAHPRLVLTGAIVVGLLTWGCVFLWGWHHLDAARQASNHGRFNLAKRHLHKCLAVWPNSYQAHLLAARVCRIQRSYPEAERHLSTCFKSSGFTEDLQREWTLLHAQTGAFPGLEPQLRNWVNDGPAQAALEALVFCLIVESRVGLARHYLDLWLQGDPDNSLALFWRGLTRQRIGEFQEAREDYARAVELDPDNSEARVQLVQLLFLKNHFDEARNHLSILATTEPDDPDVWLLLGMDRFHEAQWEEADKYFARVLTIDPTHARAIHQRGLVALQQGRLVEAERWLRLALEVKPDQTVNAPAENTPVSVSLTEPERAAAHYSLYLCLLQQPVRKQRAAAELAAYKESLELTRRLNELLAQVEKQPQDPAPLVEAAEILLQRRQTFVARQYLQRALQHFPNHEKARKLLAECLK